MSRTSQRAFHKLAVIGAGNMGSGIAQKMASEGFPVVLVDTDAEQVARGVGRIERMLAEAVERKIFRAGDATAILARVRGTTDWSELSDVDLVVEAVFEEPAIKSEVFQRLDRACRHDAILATNTSSLSVTELAAATRRPERVLGLHYFYHPAKNRLVEVVAGRRTEPTAAARAWALQEQLGKTPIAAADAWGFIVNRYFVPWLNEAVRLVEEGVADLPTVEAAAKATFGAPLGPFELMNVTGLPIALHASDTLGHKLGAFYAPARRLRQQVESGASWPLAGEPDAARFDAVAERMLAVVFHVAAALVDEGVGTAEDTDIGARVGLRWARGPFELINHHGVGRASRIVQALARRWELATPRTLEAHAGTGRPFSLRLVRSEIEDGVARLTLNRPDTMNALDEALVEQLHAAFRRAAADPAVHGIVIAGAGRAFVAGADVRLFLRHLAAGDLTRIVQFTKDGHALLDEIDRCPKPVVARLHGLALGGGLELALACDRIVASPKASVAFPETGLGIYPGLGGTQRTPRRIGPGLAKWLIFTGQMLPADEAAAIGLIDRVAPFAELDAACREAVDAAPAARSRPAEFAAVERLFASTPLAELRQGHGAPQGDVRAAKALTRLGDKAPLALGLAERLIDRAAEVSLEEGLAAELEHLVEIFRTADAREGLSALLEKRKPAFQGR